MKILCLVHPGSACGSADFNLGERQAQEVRDGLCLELDAWDGSVLVIDGELSDELPSYQRLDASINRALERASKNGFVSERLMGNDPDQDARIAEFVSAEPEIRKTWTYTVSGAWFYPPMAGCVGGVVETLRELGCHAQPSAYAAREKLSDVPELMPHTLAAHG